ncbi:hypothetical protein SaSA20_0410a [Streptococcus agalactiae]|nr:hypothetical protein SaSA20_0410a [Streptococcus agalactiae]
MSEGNKKTLLLATWLCDAKESIVINYFDYSIF